jgi:hypothetical protein
MASCCSPSCARLRPLPDEKLVEGQQLGRDDLGQVGLEPELELLELGHQLLRRAQRYAELRIQALVRVRVGVRATELRIQALVRVRVGVRATELRIQALPHGAARASGKCVAGWGGLAEWVRLGSEVDRAACAEPRKHLPELRLEHWSLVRR